MRRIVLLTVLMGVGVLSYALTNQAAQQTPAAPPAAKVIEVEKLKDNLFVLRGGGGNTAVFVQAGGITVVDTKNPGWGQPILDKIKELSSKPVTTIINTHTHGDHVSGNVEFPATVDVVVHENTAVNMKKMSAPTGIGQPGAASPPNIFDQNQGRGLPKRTFKDTMTLGSGADRIELRYYGRGHTNGDAWVLFPALRVVHAGDIFSGKNLPLLDANNGGSGVEIGNTLTKAHSGLAQSVDTVITGHSTLMTMADLLEYAQFNREFAAAVQAAKQGGKTAEEAAKAWTMPAKYTGYGAPQAARVLSNFNVIDS